MDAIKKLKELMPELANQEDVDYLCAYVAEDGVLTLSYYMLMALTIAVGLIKDYNIDPKDIVEIVSEINAEQKKQKKKKGMN
jgi:hypothetical protein